MKKERISRSLNQYHIADEAYERGMVPKTSSKRKISKLIQSRLVQLTDSEIQRFSSCLDNSLLGQTRNISVSSAEKVGEIITSNGLIASPTLLQKEDHFSLNEDHFCQVDPDKILADDDWITFFTGLYPS